MTQLEQGGSDFSNASTESKQDDIISGLDNVEVLKNKGTMSTNNSTAIPLGIDAVFTGVADDIKDYAAINISIWVDQASATDGLSIEWSQDGTNWDEKMTVSIGASKIESYEFGVRARYFRIVYTNGGTAQGAFRLQVIYHPVRTREGARCLCVDIDSREFAKTVRAILAAKKPNGTYANIHATAGGNLKVSMEEQSAGLATSAKQDTQETSLDAIQTEVEKLIGFEIPAFDYIALTYVAAGNGAGEVETVVYKTGGSGGSTVATLTLAYNASDEIQNITKT